MTDYYQDPGATASDAEDGDITNKIVKTITKITIFEGSTFEAPVDNIPLDSNGIYKINYSVTDNAGASATITRQVNISGPCMDLFQTSWIIPFPEYITRTLCGRDDWTVVGLQRGAEAWVRDPNSWFLEGSHRYVTYGKKGRPYGVYPSSYWVHMNINESKQGTGWQAVRVTLEPEGQIEFPIHNYFPQSSIVGPGPPLPF